MKILIIDDSKLKIKDIKDSIRDISLDVDEENYASDGLKRLLIDNIDYDLLILDMQFPYREGGMIERDAGMRVLRELKRKNKYIPIIICSSALTNYIDAKNLNDNVKGIVLYDSSVSMKSKFESLIARSIPQRGSREERVLSLIKRIREEINIEQEDIEIKMCHTLSHITKCAGDDYRNDLLDLCRNMVKLSNFKTLVNEDNAFMQTMTTFNNKTHYLVSEEVINRMLSFDNIIKEVLALDCNLEYEGQLSILLSE